MAIELLWGEIVPNVVHYRFQKGWTWEEFRQAALKEHTWGAALEGARYDIIGDLTHATIPSGTPFTNVARLFDQGPKNRKMIVIAGTFLARSVIQISGQVYPQVKGRFHAARDLETARQAILKLRADQP